MAILNLIHSSPNYFQSWYINDEEMYKKGLTNNMDSNIFRSTNNYLNENFALLSNCYDLLLYGINFHSAINQFEPYLNKNQIDNQQKLRNILILFGNHFLVKSNSISNTFENINIYNLILKCQTILTEIESTYVLRMDQNYWSNEDEPNNGQLNEFIHNIYYRMIYTSPEILMTETRPHTTKHYLLYSYLSGGYQLATNIMNAFDCLNLNTYAQNFGFKFGLSMGTALKV